MLKKYRSHKVVEAMQILEVEENKGGFVLINGETRVAVSRGWYQRHDIDRGWYFVRYADGYESASPPEAFEGGYTEVDEAPA